MAVFTALQAFGNQYNQTVALAATNFDADDIIFIGVDRNSGAAVTTLPTSTNLTFILLSTTSQFVAWYAIAGGNYTSEVITVTLGGGKTATTVFKVSGVDVADPFVQTIEGSGNSSISFSALADAANATVIISGQNSNTVTAGSHTDLGSFQQDWQSQITALYDSPGSTSMTIGGAATQKYHVAFELREASGGLNVTVNQATESNTSQATTLIAGAVAITLGLVTQADLAQPITPALGVISQTILQPTEVNLPQSILPIIGQVSAIANQATEAGLAQSISAMLGQVSGAVSQAIEIDLSQPITLGAGGSLVSVNQVTETDLAQPALATAGGVSNSLGQATTTEQAQQVALGTGGASVLVGQTFETNLAEQFSVAVGAINLNINQAIEIDSAQGIVFSAGASLISLGQTIEVDLAQGLLSTVGIAVISANQVFETNITFSITLPITIIGGIYNASEYFTTGASVSIELYDPANGSPVSISDSVCVEIAATGLFVWDSSKLTTQPAGYQEYVWKMTDGTNFSGGILNMFDATDSIKLDAIFTQLDDIEGGLTHQGVMRLMLSAMAGIVSGADTNQIKFQDNANTKPRITANLDGSGNRTSVTLDAT